MKFSITKAVTVFIICTFCTFDTRASVENKSLLFKNIMMGKYLDSATGACDKMLPTDVYFEKHGLWPYDCERSGISSPLYKICKNLETWKFCKAKLNRTVFESDMGRELNANNCKWFSDVGMKSTGDCVKTCSHDNSTKSLCMFFSSMENQLRHQFNLGVAENYTKIDDYLHNFQGLFDWADTFFHKGDDADGRLAPCMSYSDNTSASCELVAKVMGSMAEKYVQFPDPNDLDLDNLTSACATLNGSENLGISISQNCSECQEEKSQAICRIAAWGIEEIKKKQNSTNAPTTPQPAGEQHNNKGSTFSTTPKDKPTSTTKAPPAKNMASINSTSPAPNSSAKANRPDDNGTSNNDSISNIAPYSNQTDSKTNKDGLIVKTPVNVNNNKSGTVKQNTTVAPTTTAPKLTAAPKFNGTTGTQGSTTTTKNSISTSSTSSGYSFDSTGEGSEKENTGSSQDTQPDGNNDSPDRNNNQGKTQDEHAGSNTNIKEEGSEKESQDTQPDGNNDSQNRNNNQGKTQDEHAGSNTNIKDASAKLPNVEESGSNMMSYILVFIVLCIAGYIIFHNKKKIIAFVLEGSKGNDGRRPSTKHYKKLKTEDVLPSLEKSASKNTYVF